MRALRDSVARTVARLESGLGATRARRAQASAQVERLAATARAGVALRQARAAASAAEAERAAASAAVAELVSRELEARVGVAVRALRRDAEAAELAASGAAFFAASRGDAPRPAQVVRPRRAGAPATRAP